MPRGLNHFGTSWTYRQTDLRIRFVFLTSLLLSFILTPFFRRVALRWRIIDIPRERKLHKAPKPLLGGVAVYFAFLIPIIWLSKTHPYVIKLILAGTLVFLAGLIDDIRGLSAIFRLGVQLIAVGIVIKAGIVLSFLPHTFLGNIGEIVLTTIWIIGITNAVNCLDGVDGLVASLTITAGMCFLVIAYPTDQFLLGCFSMALAGSALGFLRYNSNPAKIFLGDAGSTFIGFMLAVIAVMGDWAENHFVSIFVPVFILGVPIFDMTLTTIMRIKEHKVHNVRQWLAYTGKDHFHHRLLDLGFGPRSTVAFMYATKSTTKRASSTRV